MIFITYAFIIYFPFYNGASACIVTNSLKNNYLRREVFNLLKIEHIFLFNILYYLDYESIRKIVNNKNYISNMKSHFETVIKKS